ncbi:MAG: vWA domain-containing protein [Dehalococcoidales bacterium]
MIEMVCIIDKSGSMSPFKGDSIGSFNTFLNEQKNLKSDINALFTMVQFNTGYDIVHNGIPIQNVPELNDATYCCVGCTALYDAVGKAIDTIGNRLSNTHEDQRPSKVIVTILTDGEENSSMEYNSEKIKKMIKTQTEDFQWEFIYLSASPNAFRDSAAMGISAQQTQTVNLSSTRGIKDSYATISSCYSSYRN